MDVTNPFVSPQPAMPPPLPELPPNISLEVVPGGAAPPVSEPRPWGFWSTAGWSLVCLILMFTVQSVVMIPFLVPILPRLPQMTEQELSAELMGNGLFLALATLATAPICATFLGLLVRWSRYPWRAYFGWRWGGTLPALVAGLGLAGFLASWSVFAMYVDHPQMADFMQQAVQNTRHWPWLAVAMVVAAPLWEELFFRGFMYQGIASSPAGHIGAIVITSVVFAAVHVQYDWFGMLYILALGGFLGLVRCVTGSTALTVLLHAMNNLAAFLETLWSAGYFNG